MFDDRIGNLQKMLARMGPEGRQRYAADHADDPIAVSMALFVNNIAKELKEGKRGEPEMQAPVVQQAIQAMNQPRMPQGMPPQGQPQAPQAMPQQQAPQGETQMAANGGYMDSRLPEEMGIGALPERSLSNMADGGIVGFNGAAESLVRSHTGGKDYFLDVPETVRDPSVPYYRMIPNPLASLAGRKFGSYAEAVQAYNNAVYDPAKATRRDQYAAPSVATMPTDDTRREGMANDPRIQGSAGAAPGAAPPADAAPRPAAATAARPTAGAPPAANAAATGIQTLVTKDLTAQDIINARKDIAFLQDPVVDPLKEERQKIVAAEKASGLEELQEHRDRVAKQGDPYAKQEERANKQEASVAESAERNPYLALMEAGFAAMSGTSQYAFENLGKGALAGTKTYREGLALIEKAKEKLNETRDRIDGLRLIRSDLNASEERTILNQNRKTALEGTRFMFEGLAKATGDSKAQVENTVKMFMEAETARRLADRQYNTEVMKQREETARNSASNAAAGVRNAASLAMQKTIAEMLPGETRATMMLGTGKTDQERLESGLQKAQEISGNPKLIIEAYTKYSKEMIDALKTPMSAEAFAAQTRALLAAMKNKGNPQDEALVNKYAPKQ